MFHFSIVFALPKGVKLMPPRAANGYKQSKKDVRVAVGVRIVARSVANAAPRVAARWKYSSSDP